MFTYGLYRIFNIGKHKYWESIAESNLLHEIFSAFPVIVLVPQFLRTHKTQRKHFLDLINAGFEIRSFSCVDPLCIPTFLNLVSELKIWYPNSQNLTCFQSIILFSCYELKCSLNVNCSIKLTTIIMSEQLTDFRNCLD